MELLLPYKVRERINGYKALTSFPGCSMVAIYGWTTSLYGSLSGTMVSRGVSSSLLFVFIFGCVGAEGLSFSILQLLFHFIWKDS